MSEVSEVSVYMQRVQEIRSWPREAVVYRHRIVIYSLLE